MIVSLDSVPTLHADRELAFPKMLFIGKVRVSTASVITVFEVS